MPKLSRLKLEFKGDTVWISAYNWAARGRRSLHNVSVCKRSDLKATLADPKVATLLNLPPDSDRRNRG